jgi:hypothetical protein
MDIRALSNNTQDASDDGHTFDNVTMSDLPATQFDPQLAYIGGTPDDFWQVKHT